MQKLSCKIVIAAFILIATTLFTYYLFSRVSDAYKPVVKTTIVTNKDGIIGTKGYDVSKAHLNTNVYIRDTVITSGNVSVQNLQNITGHIIAEVPEQEDLSGNNRVQNPLNNTGLVIPDSPFFLSYGKPQQINATFKILYWTGSSRGRKSPKNWFGLGQALFNQCEYQNCVLINNPAEYNSSDAVLMYLRYVYPTPKYRFPWQKWVMRIHEPPPNEGGYDKYSHMFNATWTYHTKSDIYSHWYYKQFVKIKNTNHTFVDRNFASGRNGTVAWFVSRCRVQSKRMHLVKELQRHTQVDVFGKCSSRPCGQRMSADCDRMLSVNYKFYLSFENSLCEEYVTEKLWRAYAAEVVPIVMGAANYSSFLPPQSYINVADFQSVKDLAQYIEILDRNDALYNAYFRWKRELMMADYPWEGCPLCKYLNLSANVTKIYHRLDRFWNKKSDCTAPELFYKDLFSLSQQ